MNTSIINEFLQKNASASLTTFMRILSFGGTFFMVFIVVYFLYFLHSKTSSIKFLMVVFVTYATTQALKSLFASPRPFLEPNIQNLSGETFPAFDHSFPSGHATIAMTIVVFLLLLLRKKYLLPLLIYPVLIAISRLYLGVHRIEDVIVGLAIGFIVPYLIYRLVNKMKLNYFHVLITAPILLGFIIYLSSKNNVHHLTVIIASTLGAFSFAQFFEQHFIKYEPKNKLIFSLYQLGFVGGIILSGFVYGKPSEFLTGDHFIFYTFISFLVVCLTFNLLPSLFKLYQKQMQRSVS